MNESHGRIDTDYSPYVKDADRAAVQDAEEESAERAKIMVVHSEAQGYVASVSYKDHHIASGSFGDRDSALEKLVQLAMEMWVDA